VQFQLQKSASLLFFFLAAHGKQAGAGGLEPFDQVDGSRVFLHDVFAVEFGPESFQQRDV
jgi:hypothetical protein